MMMSKYIKPNSSLEARTSKLMSDDELDNVVGGITNMQLYEYGYSYRIDLWVNGSTNETYLARDLQDLQDQKNFIVDICPHYYSGKNVIAKVYTTKDGVLIEQYTVKYLTSISNTH